MRHMFNSKMLVVAGAVTLAACGQGPTPYNVPTLPPQPPPPPVVPGVATTFTFCGTDSATFSTDCSAPPVTSGGSSASGFVTRVDVFSCCSYVADRAVIFLHGAGGSSCGIAHDLGLYANNVAPACSLSNSDVNGTWLS